VLRTLTTLCADVAGNPVVATSAHSVVKVRSTAHSCQKILEGSGVVITPNRVMSGAHVVAGADEFTVSVDGQDHPATVVSFDPDMDIAILDVPDLQVPPLDFAHDIAPSNSDAVVLGYPGGGPFVANPARIREVIQLKGPDIYRTKTVTREVYTIRGRVGQGDSGGPLIDLNGRVLGINFGAAADDPDTGFALTARQVYSEVIGATDAPVATGECVAPGP